MTPDPRTALPADDPGAAARPLRIFVVEDHTDTREVLCLLLETFGHSVEVAKSMQEALARVPGAGCDVLLSDIGLPDGNGWDLLLALGTSAPPYAIAMSGYGMKKDVERSVAAGFRRHLVKPLGPEHLEDALDEAGALAAHR